MQKKINYSLERLIIETICIPIFKPRCSKISPLLVANTALLTGVFNTTKEMAKIIDEHNFNQFFIKGREWKLFYQDISSLFILIVLFKDRTLLGTVKLSSERFAKRVKRIFEKENTKGIETRVLSGEGAPEEDLLEELFKE